MVPFERDGLLGVSNLLGTLEESQALKRNAPFRSLGSLNAPTAPMKGAVVRKYGVTKGAVRSATRKLKKYRTIQLHTVREANNNVSAIINLALEGTPQAITKQGAGAVVVMSAETAAALVSQAGRPRTLGDMFPVTDTNPPVSGLAVSSRPGRTKLRL